MLRSPYVEIALAVGVGAVSVGVGVGLHLWFDGAGSSIRPVPWLDRLPWAAALVLVATLPVTWWRMWARRRERAASPLGTRVWLRVLLAVQFAGVLGGLVGVLTSDPDFLFGQNYRSTITGVGGEHYHLYAGGLFCAFKVYRAEPGEHWAREVVSTSRKSCSVSVQMHETASGVRLFDATGQPLSSDVDEWNFYLGPH